MDKIDSSGTLREAIIQLELKQSYEAILLREKFHETYESIKPLSLLKSVFHEAGESDDLKDNLISTSVGLTAGVVSKFLFQGLTTNPVKKLIGTALMFGITSIVAKHPDAVRSAGQKLLHLFMSKEARSKKQIAAAEKE